jgi:outer membrane immunogenic protein
MNRTLTALTAILMSTGAALADEKPWAGFYVGAHAGYGWGGATTRDDLKDWCSPGDTACIKKFVGPFDYVTSGAFGGATLGYNIQMGAVVVGVEADGGWMKITGHRTSESSTPVYHQDHDVKGGFYALPAVRLGFAVGPALLYGKGGYVWIDGEQTQTTTKPGFRTDASGALNGWAYGGGLEYALGGGWSVKAEYLRLDLKSLNAAQIDVTDGYSFGNHTKLDAVDTAKLGINFKF